MSKATRITPKPDTDLPRSEQFYPPGTFTRVYAPQLDPVHRVWVWAWPPPAWSGLPESERPNAKRKRVR